MLAFSAGWHSIGMQAKVAKKGINKKIPRLLAGRINELNC